MATSRDPAVILKRMSKALAERIEFSIEHPFVLPRRRPSAGDHRDRSRRLGRAALPSRQGAELMRLIEARNTVVINDTSIDPLMHTVRDDVTSAGVGAAVLFRSF